VRLSILFASRAAGRYLGCVVATCGVCFLWSRYSFKIHWATDYPAVVLGIPDLSAILLTCLGMIILRPRMWIIDRLGTPTRRWIPSTGAAIAVIGGPQLGLAVAAAASLPEDTWLIRATTILFLGSLTVLVSPFVGALRAGSLSMFLYFAAAITTQLTPAVGAWSPIAIVTWPENRPVEVGKVAFALLTAAAALAVTAYTLGRTSRTWGQDLDTA
jgi:hypothetical protein